MNIFFHTLKSYGSVPAIIDDCGRCISYAELDTRVDDFAGTIHGERQLVAIEAAQQLETLIAYIAVLKYGHAALMINADIADELKERILSTYNPNYVYRQKSNSTFVLQAHNSSSISMHPDLALLLSTSGSTGAPKLVKLSFRNLICNALSIAEYLGITSLDKPVLNLPLHYSYGLSIVNSHLLQGACLCLTGKSITEKAFWTFFNEQECTTFSGVPSHYEVLHRLRLATMDMPSLRVMTQAGGKLNPVLVEYFAKLAKQKKAQFVVMYGQTEATARIAWLPFSVVFNKPEAIGKAIPGGMLWLENDRKIVTEPNVEGELVYAGANVMLGYADKGSDLAAGDMQNGILHTGDIAFQDNNGYFYITGRHKRFVKISGNRINMDDIEQTLQKKGINVVCTGEDNMLAVVSVDGHKTDAIRLFLGETLKLHESYFVIVENISVPRSSSGKIQYGDLLKRVKQYILR